MSEVKNPVRATETSIAVIEELKAANGAGVTELANSLDLTKGAVHNHLSTLWDHGYVVKDGDEYKISLKFLDLGGYRRHRMRLFRKAEPELTRLADETGELANLLTEENGQGVYLYRAKGAEALDLDTYAGMRKYLHATALGKAILAFMPSERVRSIIDRHGLPQMTSRTIGDEEELFEKLDNVRSRGVALDDEEATDGVRCVAAPIQRDDWVLGAISISAPTSRMRGERFRETVPDKVRSAANVIELNIEFP